MKAQACASLSGVRVGGATGQASLEQLVVIAAALTFIAIAFYFASSYSSDSVKIAQSQDAVERLAAGADYVYSLGPGSKDYVTIYIPEDIESMLVNGSRVVFTIRTSAGTTDVFSNTKAELIGSLPAYRGKQKILIQYLPNGKVSIGEAGLVCSPALISRTFNASQTGSDTITLTNNADFTVTGITAALTGSASAFTSITNPGASLAPGAQETFTVNYDVPVNQPSGIYGGIIGVESGNDGSCISQVTVQVNGFTSCSGLCNAQGYSSGTCRAGAAECFSNGEDYVPGNDYACTAAPSSFCCCFPTQDIWGPIAHSLGSSPPNATSSQQVSINATCNDTLTGSSYIASASAQIDGGAWSAMSANDGSFYSGTVENVNRNVGQLFAGQHIAGVRCTDTANNTGPISYLYFNITGADLIGPIITSMNHTAYPTTLTNVTETGSATDYYTGNADIQTCLMQIDGGSWFTPIPEDGVWDSPTENFYWNIGAMSSGYHTVNAYCIDALSNSGGIYNDTFGVINVDLMLVMDRSGSMTEPVTNAYSNTVVSTGSTSFTLVKSITVNAKNGDPANFSTEIRTGTSGCTVYYEARVGSDVLAYGNRTGTWYGTLTKNNVDTAAYPAPFTVDLYLKRSAGSSCTAYNRNFAITQQPTKMKAAQAAAGLFVDIIGNSTLAGLSSYSSSAALNMQLATMSTANKVALKNSINALTPSGSTCIGCGLNNAVTELTSSRSRYPNATRVVVLLTDGQNNVEPPTTTDAAANARDNDVIVYTIGFGDDVDGAELTNIALLTYGKYYYAPDYETLVYIYTHIGQ